MSKRPFKDEPLAPGHATAYASSVSGTIKLADFLDLNAFINADVGKLTGTGWHKALDALKNQYLAQSNTQNWSEIWEAPVIYGLYDNDTTVCFAADLRHNVKRGDRFYVYNMRYKWAGEVCKSELKHRVQYSNEPAALVEAEIVGDNITVAKVITPTPDGIKSGAIVRIAELLEPTDDHSE